MSASVPQRMDPTVGIIREGDSDEALSFARSSLVRRSFGQQPAICPVHVGESLWAASMRERYEMKTV